MATFENDCSLNSSYKLRLIVTETSVDKTNNKSTIHWEIHLISTSYNFDDIGSTVALAIDGEEIYKDLSQRGMSKYDDLKLGSGDKEIIHNDDGKKTITFAVTYYQTSTATYTPGTTYIPKNEEKAELTLTDIPRYTTVTASQKSKDINSISINWSSTNARDYTQYKIKKENESYSAWKDANDTVASNNKSGYFTISNLEPKTKYSIIVRVKRTDSQLWSSSEEISITTYDYAKFSSVNNSNFGDSVSIVKNNESSLDNTLQAYVGNTLIASRTRIANSYTMTFTQAELDALYKKYSNTSSSIIVAYRLLTTCNSVQYTDNVTRTITLKGNAKVVKIKQNNSIKRSKIFIKQNGIIKRAVVFIKQNGSIKRCI